ncbi:hypothetical protein CPB97_007359 [Podila verticillata]|nr:hypothetical protein CPB97_007359 [Podila verticillata]
MGGIVWNEWARVMCLTASFVLFTGGCLGSFQPMPAFDALRKLDGLYKPVPVLPVILIVLGLVVVVVEYPLVGKDYFSSSSSYMPRIALYIPLSVMAMLVGQTVHGGIYLAIGTVAYLLAVRDDFIKQQKASFGQRMP